MLTNCCHTASHSNKRVSENSQKRGCTDKMNFRRTVKEKKTGGLQNKSVNESSVRHTASFAYEKGRCLFFFFFGVFSVHLSSSLSLSLPLSMYIYIYIKRRRERKKRRKHN